MTTAVLEVRDLYRHFGGLPAVTRCDDASFRPASGDSARSQRSRQDDVLQSHRRRLSADRGRDSLFGQDVTRKSAERAHASRHRANLPDHHVVSQEYDLHNVDHLARGPAGHSLESIGRICAGRRSLWDQARGDARARGTCALATGPSRRPVYGERRRVEIAMALAQKPKLLLLDEPLAGLSADERQDIQRLLRSIPRDVTIVMIEHDMDVALASLSDHGDAARGEWWWKEAAPKWSPIPRLGRCTLDTDALTISGLNAFTAKAMSCTICRSA